jgi:hypothetical protein
MHFITDLSTAVKQINNGKKKKKERKKEELEKLPGPLFKATQHTL